MQTSTAPSLPSSAPCIEAQKSAVSKWMRGGVPDDIEVVIIDHLMLRNRVEQLLSVPPARSAGGAA